jgi:ketosteroid isomerase-like protein
MPNGNVQIVRDCYQAFQENDLEAMFAVFAPDIAWESVGRRDDFPTLGSRRGIAQVREVFRLVAENLEFHTFTPSELHGVGNIVFAMGRYEMTVRKTGRRAGQRLAACLLGEAGQGHPLPRIHRHRPFRRGVAGLGRQTCFQLLVVIKLLRGRSREGVPWRRTARRSAEKHRVDDRSGAARRSGALFAAPRWRC